MNPVERLLTTLSGVKQTKDRSWIARCPAHDDERPSPAINETEHGVVGVYCHAGCAAESVVGALGLEMKDLFPHEANRGTSESNKPAPPLLTITALAQAKGFQADFLIALGVTETPGGLEIPYGKGARTRIRTALKASDGSRWAQGHDPIVPYGRSLDQPEQARRAGYLIIVEGETDAWTLLLHGYPVLGLPGASMANKLDQVDVIDIPKFVIVREPDSAGESFVVKVTRRLLELRAEIAEKAIKAGFEDDEGLRQVPEIVQLQMMPGMKDMNEMHLLVSS